MKFIIPPNVLTGIPTIIADKNIQVSAPLSIINDK
jgi:hypothetical protein